MIVPNKVTKFRDTTINKMLIIISKIQNEDRNIQALYEDIKHNFDGIDDFIYSLDTLFVLDRIEIEWKDGNVKYVERTK